MLIPKGLPIDPRDNLERARLPELIKFAEENGVQIPPPLLDKAILIRKMLRQRGLTRIKIPTRLLGQKNNEALAAALDGQEGVTADAADDLMRQVMASAPPAEQAPIPASRVPVIVQLRQACKKAGISFDRKDKADDLRAKLDGKQNPS